MASAKELLTPQKSCTVTLVTCTPADPPSTHEGTFDDPKTHQGKFGEHLTQLIVTSAGFQCSKPDDLGDGVDLTVSRTHPDTEGYRRPPNIDFQVKSSRTLRYSTASVTIDLDVRDYNLLVVGGSTPRYLIVVDIRGLNPSDWIGHGADFIVFHRRAYWTRLFGPRSHNKRSVAVEIPRKDQLTEIAVRQMMKQARLDYTELMAKIEQVSS